MLARNTKICKSTMTAGETMTQGRWIEGARFPLAAVLIGLAVSCGGTEPGRDVSLVPHAASVVPLSGGTNIRLVDEETVCTRESYEYRVHCTDVSGSEVSYFGRQGQGPGEFRYGSSPLVRGPDSTIGVIDIGLDRMSVFSPTGTLLFFVDRDDPTGTLVRAPRYIPELPSEEEVEAYLERGPTGHPQLS